MGRNDCRFAFRVGTRHYRRELIMFNAIARIVATALLGFFSVSGAWGQVVSVVEYYNKALDAYFITGRAAEQASLDEAPGVGVVKASIVDSVADDFGPSAAPVRTEVSVTAVQRVQ
jgi:hypothetical protein